MREKELRIALICFGGVSLAVYMHGISKEMLKLVRASAALHAIRDPVARAWSRFQDGPAARGRGFDTEPVYYEILSEIGARLDLRVIVDIIAGASAGGINGTMLARALAHDLSMDRLRDLWLEKADVTELLAPEARARTIWSKGFLHPLIMGLAAAGMLEEVQDPEMRRKLSLFVRSRWFKPPFDGERMAGLMYDAITAMEEPGRAPASLLPSGQELELFVTVTDHYGYPHLVGGHDPPFVEEQEHRHVLRFAYQQKKSGEIETDFDLANAPALAFAARATSSFPGAFPPARIGEMERVLGARGASWPEREAFVRRNFNAHLQASADPLQTCFIDGAVLNSKPFGPALEAIAGRPAYRQVDRRLIYVDPDPARPELRFRDRLPGFFRTLKAALSDIPRNEPVADELLRVNAANERVQRLKGIIETMRPRVTELVARTVAIDPASIDAKGPRTAAQVAEWRSLVNACAARDCGFAYEGYLCLRLAAVRLGVARILAALLGIGSHAPAFRRLADSIESWVRQGGLARLEGAGTAPELNFLRRFDTDFSRRRLYFLIQGLNHFYEMLDQPGSRDSDAGIIDGVKRDLYRVVDMLDRRERAAFYSESLRHQAAGLFRALAVEEALPRRWDAAGFAEENAAALAGLLIRLAGEISLDSCQAETDALMAGLGSSALSSEARREAIVNYLGFPLWDTLTLSVAEGRSVSEFDEIQVDRISPEDALTLRGLGVTDVPRGAGLGHFAAFFSREYREHDYLLGRLHGIDRLIDILCDSGGVDPTWDHILALKRRAFALALDAEAPYLPNSVALIGALRDKL